MTISKFILRTISVVMIWGLSGHISLAQNLRPVNELLVKDSNLLLVLDSFLVKSGDYFLEGDVTVGLRIVARNDTSQFKFVAIDKPLFSRCFAHWMEELKGHFIYKGIDFFVFFQTTQCLEKIEKKSTYNYVKDFRIVEHIPVDQLICTFIIFNGIISFQGNE